MLEQRHLKFEQTHPTFSGVGQIQKSQSGHWHLAAVIITGSVLEALVLARASMSPADAFRATAAPSRKDGGQVPLHEWTLSSLIDVAAELKWINMDRKNFSHALRDSRNVVHPWHHLRTGADFDESTSMPIHGCDAVRVVR